MGHKGTYDLDRAIQEAKEKQEFAERLAQRFGMEISEGVHTTGNDLADWAIVYFGTRYQSQMEKLSALNKLFVDHGGELVKVTENYILPDNHRPTKRYVTSQDRIGFIPPSPKYDRLVITKYASLHNGSRLFLADRQDVEKRLEHNGLFKEESIGDVQKHSPLILYPGMEDDTFIESVVSTLAPPSPFERKQGIPTYISPFGFFHSFREHEHGYTIGGAFEISVTVMNVTSGARPVRIKLQNIEVDIGDAFVKRGLVERTGNPAYAEVSSLDDIAKLYARK